VACDSRESNFLRYFEENFDKLHLASLTAYGLNLHGRGFKYVKCPNKPPRTSLLLFNGDFRSSEGCAAIRDADVIVTNPPFSLFRDLVGAVVRYKKQFLLMGNMPTFGTKDMERLVTNRQMWFGYTGCGAVEFVVPEHYQKCHRMVTNPDGTTTKFAKNSSICWATNLPVNKPLGHNLTVKYDPNEHKKYDGLEEVDVIEVPALSKIPHDYNGVMAAPLTFLINWDSEQFDIVGFADGKHIKRGLTVDGEDPFRRVYIKRR